MIDEKKLIEEIEELPFIHDRYDHNNANIDFICGVETMYEMVINKIKEQPKIGEWITCDLETLPDKEVLCCNTDGEIILGYVFKDEASGTGFSAENDFVCMYDCVKWMEKPKP